MEKALNIAKYILSGHPMSNVRLQQLLYLIQVVHLVLYHKPAFEESIIAKPAGPVVEDVYNHFCAYGGSSISVNELVVIDDKIRKIADAVVNKYKDTYIWDLVELNTRHEGAWDVAYRFRGYAACIPIYKIWEKHKYDDLSVILPLINKEGK